MIVSGSSCIQLVQLLVGNLGLIAKAIYPRPIGTSLMARDDLAAAVEIVATMMMMIYVNNGQKRIVYEGIRAFKP